MRVAIVGAGIVGVTTAYDLAADGHSVHVFERRGGVAAEASFANAGFVAPGYVTPWAAPGMPRKVLAQWLRRHAAVRVGARLPPATIAWLWNWWRCCTPGIWQANRLRMQRLAYFSRDRLRELTRRLKLEYERSDGILVLLREPNDLALAEPGLALLEAGGTRFRLLDAAQCREVEPWLNADAVLHAGIHLPGDEVGNCRQFAHLLRGQAQTLGAEFRFHTVVQRIEPGKPPRLTALYKPPAESTQVEATAAGEHSTILMPVEPVTEEFDAIVVCAAVHAAPLLRPHGLRLPLLAVHGYSVTAPLRQDPNHPNRGPRAGLMDEHFKVAISRLGTRVRVAGSAEIGYAEDHRHEGAVGTLYKVLNDWFPGVARADQVQLWKGARPMLADGPPVIGASGLAGIWLNLGHGSSGWALACGSSRLVADALGGRPSPIDAEGFGVERLRR
jgi:D-amino-acid dehydrogenase